MNTKFHMHSGLQAAMGKNIFLTTCLMLISLISLAQPSDAAIKADLKKSFPTATEITLHGSGSKSRIFENNAYVNVFNRDVTVVVPTNNPNFPGVKVMYYGGVRYNLISGKYSFVRFSPSSEELIGMPDPNREEVNAIIDERIMDVFKLAARNEIIGRPSALTFKQPAKFKWRSFYNVSFEMETTLERYISQIGDAQKVKATYEIILHRDDELGPWVRMHASEERSKMEVLSTKKYSASEREQLQSFELILQTELAEKKWASFKPLNVPEMKDMFDVMNYIHGVFMSANPKLIENVLYNFIPSFYFVKPDFKVLTREGGELVEKILGQTSSNDFIYKNQFCEFPELKEQGNGYIDYWNKNKTAYTRLEIGTEHGKWKLGGITIYVISVPDKAREIESAACGDGRLSTVQRGSREGVSNLKRNEMVLAYYETDGYWYPATYLNYSNSYFEVQYLIDKSKGNVRKAIPFSLEPGDKAFVKLNNGSIAEVTIVSVSGENAVINFAGSEVTFKVIGLMFK